MWRSMEIFDYLRKFEKLTVGFRWVSEGLFTYHVGDGLLVFLHHDPAENGQLLTKCILISVKICG